MKELYMNTFDMVIVGDGSLEPVNKIVKEVFQLSKKL